MQPRPAVVLAILLLLSACGREQAAPRTPPRRVEAVTVRTAAATPPGTSADSDFVPGDSVLLTRIVARDTVQVIGFPRGGYRPHTVRVNGRFVWTGEMAGMAIDTVVARPGGGALVILAIIPGGTACESMFRVLELPPDQGAPRVSNEFGTCEGQPHVMVRRDRLRMFFAGYLPMPYAAMDSLPPDANPPAELYEYRGGRMVRIAVGDRAKRLSGF